MHIMRLEAAEMAIFVSVDEKYPMSCSAKQYASREANERRCAGSAIKQPIMKHSICKSSNNSREERRLVV